MQNPPVSKINSSPNPLLSMAAYQGEVFGTYVKNTESKMKCERQRSVLMSERVEELNEENKTLEENVTILSAQNETLQDSITKAKSGKELAEKKLSELKSNLATMKTTFNPKNVK